MKPTIESLQNPKVKHAQRLRDSRYRRRTGQILIDGVRELRLALANNVAVETIFVCDSADDVPWQAHSEIVQPVTEKVFAKLAYGERDNGVVAVAKAPELSLTELQLSNNPLIIVLDRVEKPGNIGAVVRTAATAGASAVVLVDPQCEVFNPNSIRASLGTVFSLPIAVSPFDAWVKWQTSQGIRVVRACVDGSKCMWESDFSGALAIVLGSEAHGLGPNWNNPQWPAVQIPMTDSGDSLNLSVSAAVCVMKH